MDALIEALAPNEVCLLQDCKATPLKKPARLVCMPQTVLRKVLLKCTQSAWRKRAWDRLAQCLCVLAGHKPALACALVVEEHLLNWS